MKICFDVEYFLCKYNINKDSFKGFIMGWIYKIFSNLLYCIDNCICFISCKVCCVMLFYIYVYN